MRHSYQELLPAPPLRPYVECYWQARSRGAPDFRPTELLVPDLRIEVIFSAASSFVWRPGEAASAARAPRGACVGMRATALAVEQQGALDTFSIRFRPAGLAALCRLRVGAITQTCVAVDDLWGAPGRHLEASITSEPSPRARARLADAFLLRQLVGAGGAQDDGLARGCVGAWLARPDLPVAEVARAHAAGYKRLERAFLRDVGITPRHFLKVARLQRALVATTTAESPPLAIAAAEAGYADQAHMTRDFKTLVGRSPRAFLAERFAVFETLRKSGTIGPRS